MSRKYQPTKFSPSHFRRSLSGADELTHVQYRILIELCEHTQIDKPCVKVSNVRLAAHVGITADAVRKNLNQLAEMGFIRSVGRRVGGNGGANIWRLIYTGMRAREDNGEPMWDPQGWAPDVLVPTPPCEDCGAEQPPAPVAQPPQTAAIQPQPTERQPQPAKPPTPARRLG